MLKEWQPKRDYRNKKELTKHSKAIDVPTDDIFEDFGYNLENYGIFMSVSTQQKIIRKLEQHSKRSGVSLDRIVTGLMDVLDG